MHLGYHIRDAHTWQSTFSSIDFVKNKTKRTKREIYKPVPPNVLKTFVDLCAFLVYFHGWMWVGVTVENTFMGGCTFLEYISVMGGCGCL